MLDGGPAAADRPRAPRTPRPAVTKAAGGEPDRRAQSDACRAGAWAALDRVAARARAGDRSARRRDARGRLPLGVRRCRHRALPGPSVPARRRRAPDRLERDGAHRTRPHVRVELAERVLVTWLVLDASASMAFGTADRRKADVAEGVAIAIGHAATRRGNRLGVVSFGAGRAALPQRRARAGAAAARHARRAPRAPPAGSGIARRGARSSSTGSRPAVAASSSSPTSAAPSTGSAALLRVAGRHPTLAVEIRDPREQELADVGELRLVDPETGRQLLVDTGDRGAARAVRGRGRRGAARARDDARLGRACRTSRSRPRATGSGRWQRSCAGASAQVSFEAPELARLACSPSRLRRSGYWVLERRRAAAPRPGRRRRCCRTSSPAPRRGWRRYVPARAAPARPDVPPRRLRAAAGDDRVTAPGRPTVVLTFDVSGSMAANDVQPDPARAPRKRPRLVSSHQCRRRTGSR